MEECFQKATVRGEGPETHLKKNGTPTMGGILILLSVVITSVFFVKDYPKIIPVNRLDPASRTDRHHTEKGGHQNGDGARQTVHTLCCVLRR
mgnify:CR=1 FL=1